MDRVVHKIVHPPILLEVSLHANRPLQQISLNLPGVSCPDKGYIFFSLSLGACIFDLFSVETRKKIDPLSFYQCGKVYLFTANAINEERGKSLYVRCVSKVAEMSPTVLNTGLVCHGHSKSLPLELFFWFAKNAVSI